MNRHETGFAARSMSGALAYGRWLAVAGFSAIGLTYAGGNPGTALGTAATDTAVNATTVLAQTAPALARDADGDGVVVWQTATATDNGNIVLQRFSNAGAKAGAEVVVNTTTGDVQSNPAVAMDAVGNFVVVWESNLQDGDQKGIYAQRYNAAGAAQGGEFKVNTFTTSNQAAPSVAMAAGGSFVVAWESLTQDGGGYGIYGQRYNAAGVAQGTEFRVNTTTNLSQRFPSVAANPAGNFVVAWQSSAQDGDLNGIYAQRYMADGTLVGSEFRLNSTTAGDQTIPTLSLRANGSFVAAWTGPDATATGIYLRRFDISNAALDVADVRANTNTGDIQSAASLTTDADGDTVVVWESNSQDAAGGYGVYFQRYNASGAAQGGETLANATTAADQRAPAVAADADGDFMIAWQGNGSAPTATATDTDGIFARRYTGPEPVDIGITKADSVDPVNTASTLSYTLTVINNHAVANTTGVAAVDAAIGSATSLVVTDPLPTGETFVSGTSSNTGWTCASAGGIVTCSFAGPYAAQTSSNIVIQVTSPATAPANNQIINTASYSDDQFDGVAGNNSASEPTNLCGPNDTPGNLSISDVTVLENAGASSAEFTVTRATTTPGQTLCGGLTVRYASSDGTATAGSDYSATSGTLSFDDSTTAGAPQTKTFTVPVLEDLLDENPETVTLTLSNASSGTLSDATGTLSITDNDAAPTAKFSEAVASVDESAGSKLVTVQLDAVSGREVSIPYTISGTATNGGATSDYTVAASPLLIPAGQTSRTLTLNIAEDSRDENDETVILSIADSTAASSYQKGTPAVHTTTILDNEAVPALSIANVSLAEGNTGSSNMSFTATLSAVSGRTVTVNYATSDGTATQGLDYTSSSGSLSFAAGETSKTFTVPVLGDALDEDDETFTVTLSSAVNASLPTPPTATGTITDDDAPVSVSFSAASQSPAESAGSVTITATLSTASGRAITAPFSLGGSATGGGTDYSFTPASPLSFMPGETSKQISVSLNNDALDETNETAVFTLGTPTNASLGTTAAHTLTITDDDATPTVSFTAAAQSVAENVAGGSATITARLSAISGQNVAVPYTVSGSATNNTDYTLTPTGTISIPAGSISAAVTVSLSNDAAAESNETVILSMTTANVSNATAVAPTAHTLTIQDDDAVPQVFFAAASQSIDESGGSASIAVRLSRTAEDDITLNYSLSGSTATQGAGADYSINPASPITIPAGTAASGIVISVPINNDAVDENDETVVVTLTSANNATVSSPAAHTITITDNDTAGVTVTPSGGTTNVTEGGATDSYSVVLNSQPVMNVSIAISGTAQATVAPTALTFTSANWNTPQTVTVTAVNDSTAEGSHSTSITQTASSGDMRYSGIAVASVAVNITDNDSPGVVVTESAGATTVAEGGATDSYSLVLATQPTADVSFSISGNAQITADKSSVSFTTANWNLAQTVTVTAVDDRVAEGSHSGLVIHGNTSSTDANYSNLAVRSVSAQIADNDTVGLLFSKASLSVSEGGAGDSYTVTLNSQPTANVTVTVDAGNQLRASSGGAAAQTISLIFTPMTGMPGGWDLPQTLSISAVDDAVAEGAHSAMLLHSTTSSDSAYQISMAGNVNADIGENDTAGVTVTPTSVMVTEGGSTASYSLVLTSQPSVDVTISITPSNAQVMASPAQRVFTSANWNTPQAVTVTAVDDQIAEGTHSAAVAHTVASGDPTYSGKPVQSVNVSISDNDTATVSIAAAASATEGGPVSFALNLSAASNRDTTVSYSSANGTAGAGDYTAVSNAMVVIAAGNTSGILSLATTADAVDEADETFTVTLTAASNGAVLSGTARTGTATIRDDDTAGITVSETGGSTAVAEGGAGDSYSVVLGSQPTANVTITISAGSQLGVNPASLLFTPANYNQTQSVSVTAVDDAVAEGRHSASISQSASSSDSTYNGAAVQGITAVISDNDVSRTTVNGADGRPVQAESDKGVLVVSPQPARPASAPANFSYDNGFFDISVTGLEVGATVTVTLTLPAGSAPVAYIKCRPDGSNCAAYSNAVISGNVIRVSLVDGGVGDDDGLANGSVRDPGAPAYAIVVPPPVGREGGGAFGWLGLVGLAGFAALRRRRART